MLLLPSINGDNMSKRKRTMFEVCLRQGNGPPCKHWAPDYIGFLCHGYNNVMQKCTGYEPGLPNIDYPLTHVIKEESCPRQ
jgi:hypothetical protein